MKLASRSASDHSARRLALKGLAAAILGMVGLAAFGVVRHRPSKKHMGDGLSEGVYCETGSSAARRAQMSPVTTTAEAPSALNHSPAPGVAPQGTIWVPGGEFWMGSSEPSFGDARP